MITAIVVVAVVGLFGWFIVGHQNATAPLQQQTVSKTTDPK